MSRLFSKVKEKIRNPVLRRLRVPQIDSALERLKKAGYAPGAVFDVGAYQGDFAAMILRTWPAARVACFEVQTTALQRLRRSLENKVEIFECLLGSNPNPAARLFLAETASSLLTETAAPQNKTANFPMRTIDDVVAENFAGVAPSLLKLDVQGYELEVLQGAQHSLSDIEVILAEVNLLDLYQGVPLLDTIVAWLSERDWLAFDICGLTRRPLDEALWQADFIFVPKGSPLRADKRWNH